jgi:membrane protein implicated in regulation of membrane protease activity
MCHLLFAMPLLALPLFWIWPLQAALPAYLALNAVSLLGYAYAWKAWRAPRLNGLEALPGTVGKVVEITARGLIVRLGGELWAATAVEAALQIGERAVVVAYEGLTLQVRGGGQAGKAAAADCPHHRFHRREYERTRA